MTSHDRSLLRVVLLFSGALASSADAMACSCSADSMLWGGYDTAVQVFEGEVTRVDVKQVEGMFPSTLAEVRFRVTRVWKGVRSAEVTIQTTDEAACGYSFEVGKYYVVYADAPESQSGLPSVSLCSRTKGGRWRYYERLLLGRSAWRAEQ